MERVVATWALALCVLLLSGEKAAYAQVAQPMTAAYSQGPEDKRTEIANAITAASRATGVDREFLIAKAHLESGLDPKAKARTSSAAGLFQFIESTWIASVERYGDKVEQAGLQGESVKSLPLAEDVSRRELLELRFDPYVASMLAAVSARDNAEALGKVLGRKATHTEMYLAHFLGSAGAVRFMRAWQRNPAASAAALFPKAARANRPIFYSGGKSRSLDDVLGHFDTKIENAIALSADIVGQTISSDADRAVPIAKQQPGRAILSLIETAFEIDESRAANSIFPTSQANASAGVVPSETDQTRPTARPRGQQQASASAISVANLFTRGAKAGSANGAMPLNGETITIPADFSDSGSGTKATIAPEIRTQGLTTTG